MGGSRTTRFYKMHETFQLCDVDSHVDTWLNSSLGGQKSKAEQQIDDMLMLSFALGHLLLP